MKKILLILSILLISNLYAQIGSGFRGRQGNNSSIATHDSLAVDKISEKTSGSGVTITSDLITEANVLFKQGASEFFYLTDSSGDTLIILDANSTTALLELIKESADAKLAITSYHDTEGTTPRISFRKADNTKLSPAAVDDDAVIGTIDARGHDGTDFNTVGARITFKVNGTPATNRVPADIEFHTADGAADDDITLKMILTEAGRLGIGTTTPQNMLDINSVTDTLLSVWGDQDGSLIASADSLGLLVLRNGDVEIGTTGNDMTVNADTIKGAPVWADFLVVEDSLKISTGTLFKLYITGGYPQLESSSGYILCNEHFWVSPGRRCYADGFQGVQTTGTWIFPPSTTTTSNICLDMEPNTSADGEIRIGDTGTAGEYNRTDSLGVWYSAGDRHWIDSTRYWGVDATDADSFSIYDDGTNTILASDNVVKFTNNLNLNAAVGILGFVGATSATISASTEDVPITIDVTGDSGTTYVQIIDDDNAGFLNLGTTGGTNLSRLSICDGGSDNEAGQLCLYEDDGNGSYLWVSTASVLRGNNSAPSDDDAGGYAICDLSNGDIGSTSQQITCAKVVSNIATITTSSDAVDVSGASVLNCDTNGGHITIGGFTGGEDGQILHLYNSDANNVVIEDDESTGNQDIKTSTGADVTITAEGGATLIYDGTDGVWRMIGLAQ